MQWLVEGDHPHGLQRGMIIVSASGQLARDATDMLDRLRK